MLDIKPLMSRIIVKQKDSVKKEEVEKIGSIYVPEVIQDRRRRELEGELATEGEVVAVGNEVDIVKVGDKVYWGKYSGSRFTRNGKEYIIMTQEDLLALIGNG